MQRSWRVLRDRAGRAWSGSKSRLRISYLFENIQSRLSHSLAANDNRDVNGGLLSEALQGICELLAVDGASGVCGLD